MKNYLLLKVAILISCITCAYINQDLSTNDLNPFLSLGSKVKTLSTRNIDFEKDNIEFIKKTNNDSEFYNNLLKDSKDIEEDYNFEKKKVPEHCSKGSYYISSIIEMNQIQDCNDIIGSILISNYHDVIIDTGMIQNIIGDFIIKNITNLVRVNTPNLIMIEGRFVLNELTSLTVVNSPYLNIVNTIEWEVLPILSTVTFETGITNVKSIIISDTSLVDFSGFNSEVLNTLNINNNRFLESINIDVKSINEKLLISSNARNLFISFSKLEWANNITIRDVSLIDFNNLESVNTSLEFINNNFQALKFPKLKSIGGTLSLIENYHLKEVEFNNVNEIGGGLMIVNNTFINKINFFSKLISVGGAIKFIGDLKEANFNKLKIIKGSALIESISDMFDCTKWTRNENESSGSIIRGGSIVCRSGNQRTTFKYGTDGEVLDEQTFIIDDSNENEEINKKDFKNESIIKSGSLMAIFITFIVILII